MSQAFAAVVAWTLFRAVWLGYGGQWFFPVVGSEVVQASALLGVAALLLILWRRFDQRPTFLPIAEGGAVGALLFGGFGWAWVEPHAALTSMLPGSIATTVLCYFVGAATGCLVAVLFRRSQRAPSMVWIWALVGFLVFAPTLYDHFDHVLAGRRWAALVGVSVSWVAAAWAAVALSRRVAFPPQTPALAVILAAVCALVCPGPRPSLNEVPSIIVVLVDTLRADSLDRTTEDGSPLMPELSQLARQGVRFTQAVAPAPWTLPSTVSLLSAWNPHRHFVGREAGDLAVPGRPEAFFAGPLLRSRGYTLAGFVNNPYLRPYFGLGQGWLRLRRYHGRAEDGAALALNWAKVHARRPHFLLLHLMDPHWPYDAPPGWGRPRRQCSDCDSLLTAQYGTPDAEARDEIQARYQGEVLYTDAVIGRFVGELRDRGLLENSWLIVTSDHGEEFWEHGNLLHGHSLYDEQLRIPLVVVPPIGSGESLQFSRGVVVDDQVALEDVGATILALAGVEAAAAGPVHDDALLSLHDAAEARRRLSQQLREPMVDGRSLLHHFAPGTGDHTANSAPRAVVAGFLKASGDLRFAVRGNSSKWISAAPDGSPELYALVEDPGEEDNLLQRRSPAAPTLQATLKQQLASSGLNPASRRPLDPDGQVPAADLRRQLQQLGYVD